MMFQKNCIGLLVITFLMVFVGVAGCGSSSDGNNDNTSECGDNQIQSPEVCDGTDFGDQSCVTEGFEDGDLACNETCTAILTDGCFNSEPECNNNQLEGTEVCDGDKLAGKQCSDFGFDGGDLACNDTCSGYVTDACTMDQPACNNDSQIDDGELCDGIDVGEETCETQGFDGGELVCNNTCDDYDTSDCYKQVCTSQEIADFQSCFDECPQDDQTCQEACADVNLTTECNEAVYALSSCAAQAGCGNDVNCMIENCEDLYRAVMGVDQGNSDIPAPYGIVTLDFASDYVRDSSNGPSDASGVLMSAFGTGSYGSTDEPIPPTGISMNQSYAIYASDPQMGNVVQVMQINVSGSVPVNPTLVAIFPENLLAVGEVFFGLEQGNAQLSLVDVNFSTQQIICVHAMGVGTLDITEVGDYTNHGALSFGGTLDLYHTQNFPPYGDISAQMPTPSCDPF
jgi:hypothetical protein